MKQAKKVKLLFIAAIITGLMAATAYAVPLANLSYQETSLGGGLWQYDYTLSNLSGPGYGGLYDAFFFFDPAFTMSIAALPGGWDGFGGNGFGEVYAMDPAGSDDILPGASLGGFSFIFDAPVGSIDFEALFTNPFDPLNPEVAPGVTVQANAAAPVPEPSTMLLVVTGVIGLAAFRMVKSEGGQKGLLTY